MVLYSLYSISLFAEHEAIFIQGYHWNIIILLYLFISFYSTTAKRTSEKQRSEREKEIAAKKYDRQMNQKASETFKVQLNQLLRRVLKHTATYDYWKTTYIFILYI